MNVTSFWFRGLIIGAFILLIIGLITPMMSVQQFYFFENSFSGFGGVLRLFKEQKFLLAGLISLFSIVLPVAKLLVLFKISLANESQRIQRYLKLMHDYGRWAMLDVLIVAVLIVTVKLGALATVSVHWGLYVFMSSVLMTLLLTEVATRSQSES